MPLLVVTLCINAEHLKLLFVSVSFHWEFLRTFHRVLFRIQLSYGLGVSAWYKCWIYLCIIPLIRRKIFWHVGSNLRGWLGCQSEGSRKKCQTDVRMWFESEYEMFLRKKRCFGITWKTWMLLGVCWPIQGRLNSDVLCASSPWSGGESSLL